MEFEPEDMPDEIAQVNSEMRCITIELMKLAAKRRVSFHDISAEFVQNVYVLKHAIRQAAFKKSNRNAKTSPLAGVAERRER